MEDRRLFMIDRQVTEVDEDDAWLAAIRQAGRI